MNLENLIRKLDLIPHPEGGFFKEVYRSNELVDEISDRFGGARNISTSIYFLLKSGDKSYFHKIKSDETWHFYAGSAVKIHMITSEGDYSFALVGSDIFGNEQFQFTVQKEVWFAAEILDKESYGLFGCTVAPGFDFADFKLATANELTRICPKQEQLISAFTLA